MTTEAPSESKIDFLLRLPLFRGLRQTKPGSEGGMGIGSLARITKEYEFRRGDIIAYEGDVADKLYIVRKGTVQAFNMNNETRNYEFVGLHEEGSYFYDYWLFKPRVHEHTLRASTHGRLLIIGSKDFLNLIRSYPRALPHIYPQLSAQAKYEVEHSRFQAYLDQGGGLQRLLAGPGKNGKQTSPRPSEELRTALTDLPKTEEEARREAAEFIPNRDQLRRYEKIQLLPDEFVEFDRRRSTKIMYVRAAANLGLALFLLLLPIPFATGLGFTPSAGLLVGVLLALIPLFNLLFYWIDWLNAFFVITNQRLIRYELQVLRLSTVVEKIEVEKVQSVEIDVPNFIASWLKIGTARITTAAQSSVLYFDYIDQPKDVETTINNIKERNRGIAAGRERAILRKSIEGYLGVKSPYEREIKDPKPPPKPKTFRQLLRERFVRMETPDAVIYHKHPVALLRAASGSIIVFFLLLTSAYGFYFFSRLMLIPAFLGVYVILFIVDFLWFLWQLEDWRNDTFMVTERYIFDIDRLPLGFAESRKQAELSRIQNVTTEQEGLLATIFNFGNVQVETAGAESNIVFENVRDPNGVQNQIFAKREAFRRKREQEDAERQRRQSTELIDLYHQITQHQDIPDYQPFPDEFVDDADGPDREEGL